MTVWRSFGASVIGPAHLASRKPNQDSWASFHRTWGDGVVVSDGLGSRPFSHLGSRTACLAVMYAFRECCDSDSIDHNILADCIKHKWISLLEPLRADDCAATCLFAARIANGVVHLGMLGDGLVAVIRCDGTVLTLSDNKSQGFSNITVALSSKVSAGDWQWLALPEEDCQSAILCTDGIADDLSDTIGFVKEFWNSHRDLSSLLAARRSREMLEKWPTPGHADDKTIACLFREEGADA
ncbi:MAG: protein phosphatase [Pirellulaceae bacterium]|nr:MAG: protein phosphatase [Pirellulaceae bacterium]